MVNHTNKSINIGITGTGSLIGQALIKSVKKSYLYNKLKIKIIGFDYIPDTIGSYWVDENIILPDMFYNSAIDENKWLDEVIIQIKKRNIDILFLGIDFELPVFSKFKTFIEDNTNVKIIVSDSEVINIANDKYDTYNFLKKNNLSFPTTFLINEFREGNLSYPFILKPRIGARSRDVYLIHSFEEFQDKRKLVNQGIVQENIGTMATEYTCGVIFLDGEVKGKIALKRVLKDGNTFKAEYHKDLNLYSINSYLDDVASTLKPFGTCNFQLRIDKNGQPKIFEINARHSGTTFIRAFFGFEEVTYIIEYILGLEHKQFDMREGVVHRYYDEFFVEAK